ncbi:glutathione S-transferase sigma [Brachionus plicatilis]|uniref:Glutathione S-transferase sigma n=1 Tax=Brachionus plicatilis TaxID=10195 RepID=A0A3M7RTJ4_BRAPC|nr:glutathione S-transferase sigma [Brachionus plicatilis]
MYGSNGYSVGDSLSWADLAIFDVIFSLLSKHPEFSEKFPALNAVYENVKANPGVAEYHIFDKGISVILATYFSSNCVV